MSTAVVSGQVLNPDDSPQVGTTVRALPATPGGVAAFGAGNQNIVASVQTTTDSNGRFSLTLERTDTMQPTGSAYRLDYYPAIVTPLAPALVTQYITVPLGGGTVEALLTQNPVTDMPQFSIPANRWLSLPGGWSDCWNAAKATLATTPAWAGVFGDSIGQGFYATDPIPQGFMSQILAGLKTLYASAGEYAEFWPVADSLISSASYSGAVTQPPWTMNDTTHGVALNTGCGFGATALWYWAGAVNNPMATFVTPVACTAIDIHWTQYYNSSGGGTWSYTIDGGATQNVTIPANGPNQIRTRITGLANAVHTLRIVGQSADYNLVLNGASIYPNGVSAGGIGLVRASLAGDAGAYYIHNNVIPNNGLGYSWLGGVDNSSPSPFGFPTAPHLSIFEYGVNDASNANVTVGQFKLGVSQAIRAIRKGRPNASILLVAVCHPDVNNSDIGVAGITVGPAWWDAVWVPAIKELADTFQCGFVDFSAKWGSTPYAQGFINGPAGHSPHPTTAGHTDMANTILSIL